MSPTFNPLPICPNPIQWDVQGRIAELEAMIRDPATNELQKKNLHAAISLYGSGDLPGPFRFIQDGKVIPHTDIDFHRPYWVESIIVTGWLTFNPPSAFKPATGASHDIISAHKAKVLDTRPIPGLLSPAFPIETTMLNDTGSNTMTVFDTDLTALAIPSTYLGLGPEIPITTAGGTVMRRQITVEVQLVDFQGNPVSEWIQEVGVVAPADPGALRLSGDGIRKSLYFATAPGNQHLYVAAKKQGIVDQLPVV
ncbi:hypothetical protein FQN50_009734 [Emmonsiellopsis sp. PD_5]|nr:hypothetical protein FQN50_009734 [Emmonsiellopsis sp. PD_5]